MTGDELLTLPLVLWVRLRLEGLPFGVILDAKDPDLWRFRFAPMAELHVSTHGDWAWRGAGSRARRLVVPLVEEAEVWLAGVRAADAPPPSRAVPPLAARWDPRPSAAPRSAPSRTVRASR